LTAYLTAVEQILTARGLDHDWAWQVHAAMITGGLVDVDTVVQARSWPGGTAGALHHTANVTQLRARILEAGLTVGQLDRLCRLWVTREWWFAAC
jgi:hypothetical protein